MMQLNSVLQLIMMICVHDDLSTSLNGLNVLHLSALTIFVFWTAWSLGLTFDEADEAPLVEFSR